VTARVAIGVDIGGTRLRAALVTDDGQVLAREASERPVGDGPEGLGDAVVDALAALTTRLGTGIPVGVGIASLVGARGQLVQGANLDVTGYPLQDRAAAALGVAVSVANDATVACLAESRVGAARGHQDVILLTVGTGVGGGAIVDGRLLRGAHGLATEFGHIVVAEGGRRCACGSHGCVEAYASGQAIGAIVAERLAAGRTSTALAREPVVDGAAVTRAVAQGDGLALEVVREAGHWLGVVVAGLVNALDPALVVIGGGAGEALSSWLLPVIEASMAPRVLGHRHRTLPPVHAAALGDDAGVVGAALLALDEVGTT
jgi:glucokinase